MALAVPTGDIPCLSGKKLLAAMLSCTSFVWSFLASKRLGAFGVAQGREKTIVGLAVDQVGEAPT